MELQTRSDIQNAENLINKYYYVLEDYANSKIHQLFNLGIKNISKSEIISIGYSGFCTAANMFDETKNDDFSGYARKYVDYAFKQYQREIDPIDHRPRAKIKKIKKISDTLSQEIGRPPTDEEIAKSINMKEEEVQTLKKLAFEQTQSFDGLNDASDLVGDNTGADFLFEKEEREDTLGRDMNNCLKSTLSEEKRLIFELKYLEKLSTEEISKELWDQVTEKQKIYINNTNKNAKLKLKKCMEKKGWAITDV